MGILKHGALGVGLAAAALVWIAGAPGQAQPSGQGCASTDAKVAVEACTALVNAPGATGPALSEALLRRGYAYGRLRRWTEARADFDRALTLTPTAQTYYARALAERMLGDVDPAIADYSEAIRLDPNTYPPVLDRALAYMMKGDFDRGIPDMSRALELKPDLAIAYHYRGLMYHLKEDNDRALADLNRYIELQPNDYSGYQIRGTIYDARDEYKLAIADYQAALKLKPEDVTIYIGLGNAYRDLHDWDNMVRNLDHAVQILPNDAGPLAARCFGKAALGRDLDHALEDCDQAIRLRVKPGMYLRYRAFVYYKRKDYAPGLADAEAALRFTPKDANTFFIKGLIEIAMGRAAEGRADIAAAQALDVHVTGRYAKWNAPV